MSFPPATEMFQFAGFASHGYEFTMRYPLRGGFPHSDIRGSMPIGGSPQLFAAYHVLHRLLAPRHPPNALFTLDLSYQSESIAHRDKTPRTTDSVRYKYCRNHIFIHDKLEPEIKTWIPVILMFPLVWHCLAPRGINGLLPFYGGADRDRTDDLLLAKQALSQLSYGPD